VKLQTFLKIAAVEASLFGAISLVIPEIAGGVAFTSYDVFLGRSIGGLLMTLGIINWSVRKEGASNVLRGILWANAFMHTTLASIDVTNTIGGTLGASAWFGIIVHAAFLTGFSYYLIRTRVPRGTRAVESPA
jgi:hypothetical protein